MKRQAYKFRLYPTEEQAQLIQRTFGCCRVVWNLMLESTKASHCETKKFTYPGPTAYKEEHAYLRMVDAHALCNVQMNLRSAFLGSSRTAGVKRKLKIRLPTLEDQEET